MSTCKKQLLFFLLDPFVEITLDGIKRSGLNDYK